jgi:hypothetical protein
MEDYKPGDEVTWTNPANGRDFSATLEKEVLSQSSAHEGNPTNPGSQRFPSVSERERRFEIRVKETGKTITVPVSQLRRPK